jgi:hypothetical protein
VSAKTSGLAVLAAQDAALYYGRCPQAGAERDHYQVITASAGAVAPFTNRGHSGIVFQSEWQT